MRHHNGSKYNEIKDDFYRWCFKQNDIESNSDVQDFLLELKEVAGPFYRQLRENGKPARPSDYEKMEIQIAYVLRYFHLYFWQTYTALMHIWPRISESHRLKSSKELYISCFGSGPGPELIGISQFFQEERPDRPKKIINLYDRKLKYWQEIRESFIVTEAREEIFSEQLYELHEHNIDFMSDFSADSCSQIEHCDVAFFQNCLTELVSTEELHECLSEVIKVLREHGLLVFTDRKGDHQSRGAIEKFCHDNCFEILENFDYTWCDQPFRLPEGLGNFFDGRDDFHPSKKNQSNLLIARLERRLASAQIICSGDKTAAQTGTRSTQEIELVRRFFDNGTRCLNNREGEISLTWPNGSKYIGKWEKQKIPDDLRAQHGIFTWPNGGKYIGSLNNYIQESSISDEQCNFSWDNNAKTKESSGHCTCIWPDGAKYTGGLVDNLRYGMGTFTWPNGDRYHGDWLNGKRDGSGEMIYAEGGKFKGTWNNDKKNGDGTYQETLVQVWNETWTDGECVKKELDLSALRC